MEPAFAFWTPGKPPLECGIWKNTLSGLVADTTTVSPSIFALAHLNFRSAPAMAKPAEHAVISSVCPEDIFLLIIDAEDESMLAKIHDFFLNIARNDGRGEQPDLLITTDNWWVGVLVRGDTDRNETVDGLDLTAIVSAWQSSPGEEHFSPDADLDHNGIIDGLDLTEVLANFGTSAQAAVPSPSSAAMLLAAAPVGLRRTRRRLQTARRTIK